MYGSVLCIINLLYPQDKWTPQHYASRDGHSQIVPSREALCDSNSTVTITQSKC